MPDTEIQPLFISDLVDIAREVYAERDASLSVREDRDYVSLRLAERGHAVDSDMWDAAIGLVRTAIGPHEDDYLFAFPYPDLVIAALALVGRPGDWSNLFHDVVDQHEVDYPEGTCVPNCDGACPDFEETGCMRDCSGQCHHRDVIGAAYERAGIAALHIDLLVSATEHAITRTTISPRSPRTGPTPCANAASER